MKSVKKYNMHKKIITLFYCVVGATLSVLAQEKNLADLLSAQIEYPLAAQQNKVSGAVVVDVLITEKGEMKKIIYVKELAMVVQNLYYRLSKISKIGIRFFRVS